MEAWPSADGGLRLEAGPSADGGWRQALRGLRQKKRSVRLEVRGKSGAIKTILWVNMFSHLKNLKSGN